MVLRNLDNLNSSLQSGSKTATQYNQSLVRMRSSLSNLIVPGLGAFGAMSLLQGAMGGAADASLALTAGQARLAQSMFKLKAGLQEAISPALVKMADLLEIGIGKYLELDKTSGGVLSKITFGVVGVTAAVSALGVAAQAIGFVLGGLAKSIRVVTGAARGLTGVANAATRAAVPNRALAGIGQQGAAAAPGGGGAAPTAAARPVGAAPATGARGITAGLQQQAWAVRQDLANAARVARGATQQAQNALQRAGAATGGAGRLAGAAVRGLGPGLALGALDYFAAREDDTRARQDKKAAEDARRVQERRARGEFVPGPGYFRPEPLQPGQAGFQGPVRQQQASAGARPVTVNQTIYNYGNSEELANRMMRLVQEGLADLQANP